MTFTHFVFVHDCDECDSKIKCVGKPYKVTCWLDYEFHAKLNESAWRGLPRQVNWFTQSSNARHSNAVKSSHNGLIRFRSKDIPLQRLHYHVSTNLGLLQANLTYMQGKFGTSYHWIPELYHRMKLPVFEGVVEALERDRERRKKFRLCQ